MIVSPAALKKIGIDRRKIMPADIKKFGLLHHINVPTAWREWFTSVQLERANPQVGPRFDQFTLIVQTVLAGIGAAVVPQCLIVEELRTKRLIAPFRKGVTLSQGYFLCTPESKAKLPSLTSFRRWLLSEANTTP